MDNYEISRDHAQTYFLRFDQDRLIRTWNLAADADFLQVRFLGKGYRIARETGQITRLETGMQAGFSEVLSIFDFLCHEGSSKFPAGEFATVNSLHGVPKTAGVSTDFHTRTAAIFDQKPDALKRACLAFGGTPVNMGDIGFRFPLFSSLEVILKFYRSDEDFPAGITLLWDRNLLQYIHYETVFYIAGFLLDSLCRLFDTLQNGDTHDGLL